MAHGWSSTKRMYLDRFAEVFAAAGLAVLVFDNRGWGESGTAPGKPRHEIDLGLRDGGRAEEDRVPARRVLRRLHGCGVRRGVVGVARLVRGAPDGRVTPPGR